MNDYAGYIIPECKECPYWSTDETWYTGCISMTVCDCLKRQKTENTNLHLYSFSGLVTHFGNVIEYWKGKTLAVSKEKARSNLTYQYKIKRGYSVHTQITLQDEIVLIK